MTQALGPFRFGHHTDKGPRDSNQDTVLSIALSDDRWLLAVADGMGGLEEGELASKTALGALFRSLSGGAGLVGAVGEANAAVCEEARGRVMGTTLVAAVVSGRQAEIANVGDSRAYRSDSLGLLQITRDHTMALEAERTGALPPGGIEFESGRWAGALARYLGSGPEVEVDRFGPIDLLEGGWMLLCSDGLHGVVSVEEMDDFLAGQSDVQGAATGLVALALERSTNDNVSAALVHWPATSPEPDVLPDFPTPQKHSREIRGRRGKILIGPKRTHSSRKVTGLAVKVFLIVIPLVIVLFLLLDWILSP